MVQAVVESPTIEDFVGGPHCVREISEVIRVAVSVGTPGSGGSFVINVKVDGVTIFTTPANQPSLAHDDSDKVVVVSLASIENPNVPANGILTFHVEGVQAGTPRWLRIAAWVRKIQDDYSASDY